MKLSQIQIQAEAIAKVIPDVVRIDFEGGCIWPRPSPEGLVRWDDLDAYHASLIVLVPAGSPCLGDGYQDFELALLAITDEHNDLIARIEVDSEFERGDFQVWPELKWPSIRGAQT